MTHHDHSKVGVDELGIVRSVADIHGNVFCAPFQIAWDDCPAYGRYIDRRVSHPNEDPRASARWANDWPASAVNQSATWHDFATIGKLPQAKGTTMEGCMYIVGKDGKSHKAGTPEAIAAMPKLPVFVQAGEAAPPPPKPWPITAAEVQRVESAQDEYPPVIDRPTFVLALIITALAGMLVGLIAGAMVMA